MFIQEPKLNVVDAVKFKITTRLVVLLTQLGNYCLSQSFTPYLRLVLLLFGLTDQWHDL